MRILQVARFYHPYKGGMETVLRSLCEGLRDLGHEVFCLVANTSGLTVTEVVGGIHVVRVASFGTLRSVSLCPGFIPAFRTLARAVDIIHIHQQNPLADVAVIGVQPAVPLVITCHSAIVRQRLARILWKPLLTHVRRRAQRVIVASPPMVELIAADDVPGLQPHVIPFGIDLSAIDPPDTVPCDDGAEPFMLSVGRLVSYKGFEYLIAALANVPTARLVLVGDGPLRVWLRQQAVKYNVHTRVEFAGEVSGTQLAELYRRCAVFVLPSVSLAEAFGMVQLEAMAYGKPVVSTALPTGVPWVNRHGETGLIVPPRSSQALAHALNTLLASPALRHRMGAAGRRRVEKEFTVELMVRRYAGIYAQAIEADTECAHRVVVPAGKHGRRAGQEKR
jgi:rhamnosyl/mannosyltransferase